LLEVKQNENFTRWTCKLLYISVPARALIYRSWEPYRRSTQLVYRRLVTNHLGDRGLSDSKVKLGLC